MWGTEGFNLSEKEWQEDTFLDLDRKRAQTCQMRELHYLVFNKVVAKESH